MSEQAIRSKEIELAFKEYDRQAILKNLAVGCLIGIVLIPSGSLLDYFVYNGQFSYFLKLRLLGSLLIALFWAIVATPFGRRHPRELGVLLAFIPAFIDSWMIYATDGADSSYYAGYNLVLLVVGLVLHWTFLESLVVVSVVTFMYVSACMLHGAVSTFNLLNNLYFMFLTGVIVATGSYVHSKIRFSEFALRYQLDKSKHELEESNRKLIELDQLKSRFFANVSHELRTPLTLLLAPLETLIQKFDRQFDDHARELLQTMHSNGMRLLKLINDLLDLIRLESGRLQIKPEPVAVNEFINGLASAVRQVAQNKEIKLETRVDPELGIMLADRDKLEKIALNLLFNATKFTPQGGQIWLRAEKQGPEFVFTVSDNGVGIAEKSLPFVFDRFWQEDGSSKRKFQGVGIGLALVKELAEAQDGKVAVESQEGRGATFTVRLPYVKGEATTTTEARRKAGGQDLNSEEWLTNLYRRAELFPAVNSPSPSKTAPPPGSGQQRPLVLVCDDEPDMRRFLRLQLAEEYDVVEAADGNQAAEKAQHYLPDILLLDLMMPHKDGLQVCRELRAYAPTAGIPIILLTARADEEAKFDALQMGANDFLAKPFSSIELQARVKNLIERHHYQRRISKQNKELTNAIEQIKETEMQLVQSEKLSSLGRLSAGIIHEINNPLNFTMTGLFALRNKLKHFPAEQRKEYDEILTDIEDGVKRVRNIVSDLRTFTHPGGGLGEPVDVVDAAEAALRFLSGEWKDRVKVEQNLPAGHMVYANRNKLIHVLVNLLQNSIDAMQEKKYEEGTMPTVRIEGRTEGDRSLILVRDNGPGIDPKLVDKIFDPFFTTKDVGKGMGLGLSICYRIVHGYGGTISVRSEKGKFCEFTLNFPWEKVEAEETEAVHGQSVRL